VPTFSANAENEKSESVFFKMLYAPLASAFRNVPSPDLYKPRLIRLPLKEGIDLALGLYRLGILSPSTKLALLV